MIINLAISHSLHVILFHEYVISSPVKIHVFQFSILNLYLFSYLLMVFFLNSTFFYFLC